MERLAWTSVGTLAALLTSLGFLPQVLKMWQRRSVGDVSVATLAQFTAGVALWTVYGLYIRAAVVVIANLVTLITLVAGLLSYWRFRPSPAGGTIRGAVLAAEQAGADPIIAAHEAAKGLIQAAGAVNGNLAVLARAAVREAADCAKARELRMTPSALARAAAHGAVEGSRDLNPRVAASVRQAVKRALDGVGLAEKPHPLGESSPRRGTPPTE